MDCADLSSLTACYIVLNIRLFWIIFGVSAAVYATTKHCSRATMLTKISLSVTSGQLNEISIWQRRWNSTSHLSQSLTYQTPVLTKLWPVPPSQTHLTMLTSSKSDIRDAVSWDNESSDFIFSEAQLFCVLPESCLWFLFSACFHGCNVAHNYIIHHLKFKD